ncbi:O-Antigen ligase [compost metagenome]
MSNFARTFKLGLAAVAVILAILLSTSSLGYLGLFVSAAITIMFGIKLRHVWVLLILLPLFGFGAYKVSQLDFFQMRMNDTLAVLSGAELTMTTGMNISTYSLAVNMSMSLRSLQDNYGFGIGFGNYSAVFDHYIHNYEMPNYRDDLPGRGSATSLFARLTAELGVAAWLIFIISFLWSWREIRRGDMPAISIAYTATLMIILLRMGEYYVNGVILVFLMIYWFHVEGQLRRAQASASLVRSSHSARQST